MRKIIILFIIIFSSVILYSESNFFLNLYPVLSLNNYPLRESSYSPTTFDLFEYYSYPSFGALGIKFLGNNYLAFFRIDLRQDITTYLRGKNWSNLLLDPLKPAPYVDTNMPMVGFAQYENNVVKLSVGRRKLKYGPSTYDFTLSDSMPYFDHIWFDLKSSEHSPFSYNYFIVSGNRSVFDTPRTLIGHKVGFETDFLRLSIEENNLVSDGYPDLQDLSPFAIFHNNYNKHTNVNAAISVELKLETSFMYGKLLADDIKIPGDRTENPTSLGWNAGITYLFFNAPQYSGPKMWEQDYALREDTHSFTEGGLKLSYEHYHSTPYLYNRQTDSGKYIYPVRLNAANIEGGEYLVITGFFGFPYGPDCTLEVIKLSFEKKSYKLTSSLEILRKGDYGINDPYGEPFSHNWYSLVKPITYSYYGNIKLLYCMFPNQELLFSVKFSIKGEFLFNFKVGYGIFFGL